MQDLKDVDPSHVLVCLRRYVGRPKKIEEKVEVKQFLEVPDGVISSNVPE